MGASGQQMSGCLIVARQGWLDQEAEDFVLPTLCHEASIQYAGCTAHPYTVCRGEDYCTPTLSHEEAIERAEHSVDRYWPKELQVFPM